MPTDLLGLAKVPLEDLLAEDAPPVLEEIVRRLCDPDERDRLTVSAFGSAL